MIDTLLALVPLYGLFLIAGVVTASCLAIPLPSSMLVMASGGFAAAGDLVLWQVIAVAFAGFVLGDQLAFNLARWGGTRMLERMKANPKRAGLIARGERMVDRWGVASVLASRTIVSPMGPWTSYIGGAAGLGWFSFTAAALLGAAIWSVGYALLGYLFADQISTIASMIVDGAGVILAGAVAVGSGWWLRRSWVTYKQSARQAK